MTINFGMFITFQYIFYCPNWLVNWLFVILLLYFFFLVFRYLLATNEENDIVAASHFRFDIDEGIEVLYW